MHYYLVHLDVLSPIRIHTNEHNIIYTHIIDAYISYILISWELKCICACVHVIYCICVCTYVCGVRACMRACNILYMNIHVYICEYECVPCCQNQPSHISKFVPQALEVRILIG